MPAVPVVARDAAAGAPLTPPPPAPRADDEEEGDDDDYEGDEDEDGDDAEGEEEEEKDEEDEGDDEDNDEPPASSGARSADADAPTMDEEEDDDDDDDAEAAAPFAAGTSGPTAAVSSSFGVRDPLPEAQAMVVADRDLLEKGTRAYVAHARAYQEHQCQFIFRFAKLDLAAVARAFALVQVRY